MSSLVSLLIRTFILSDQAPTLTTSLHPGYVPRGTVYISKYSHPRGRAPTHEFEGDANIQSITGLPLPRPWSLALQEQKCDSVSPTQTP